eukprot:9058227-Pyramimonas_sp.AAC.1
MLAIPTGPLPGSPSDGSVVTSPVSGTAAAPALVLLLRLRRHLDVRVVPLGVLLVALGLLRRV